MTLLRSLAARLTVTLLVLLIGFGLLVATLSRQLIRQDQDETLQRLSSGLARHIVEHWPEVAVTDLVAADTEARKALLSMLMTVNPGVQVYVLDADGRVAAYIGPPGMVQQDQVDLATVRRFLAGADLPLRGVDPMGSGKLRLFSAAMFPPRSGDTRPPGYLYIVLDGASREQAAAQLGSGRAWRVALVAISVGLAATALIGLIAFGVMTLPLSRLAARMRVYSGPAGDRRLDRSRATSDEVRTIETAFTEMTHRIESQVERERAQTAEHRETMAGVAHDLRTPLTALHGLLESLASPSGASEPRILTIALAQSDKLRRLCQQLFELAALQASERVTGAELFRLDELVTDTVKKFEFGREGAKVEVSGASPGRIELLGDLQLVERALTNLIDNAVRHGGQSAPVKVSLHRAGEVAEIVVEDAGAGLPEDLRERLERDQSVRDPPGRRGGGGIGGLGLAIAQRVAALHGGSLRALPGSAGGARMCLTLSLTPPARA